MPIACVKGGTTLKSQNEDSKRKCSAYIEDLMLQNNFFVRFSFLTVCMYTGINKEGFLSLCHKKRLQLSENVKDYGRYSFKVGTNKKSCAK